MDGDKVNDGPEPHLRVRATQGEVREGLPYPESPVQRLELSFHVVFLVLQLLHCI